MFLPWNLDASVLETPLRYGAGYIAVGLLLLAWHVWLRATGNLGTENKEELH